MSITKPCSSSAEMELSQSVSNVFCFIYKLQRRSILTLSVEETGMDVLWWSRSALKATELSLCLMQCFAPHLVLCIIFPCEGKVHFPVYGRKMNKASTAEVWWGQCSILHPREWRLSGKKPVAFQVRTVHYTPLDSWNFVSFDYWSYSRRAKINHSG